MYNIEADVRAQARSCALFFFLTGCVLPFSRRETVYCETSAKHADMVLNKWINISWYIYTKKGGVKWAYCTK